MNRREAKRWACRRIATLLEADTTLMEYAIYEDDLRDEDADRIYDAIAELAVELRRRGGQ